MLLTDETRLAANMEASCARYAADPWAWLTEQVITVDEATQRATPWPDKPHLRALVVALQEVPWLVIPKSRRMMVTWALAAWCVWKARHAAYHQILIQSETESKAAFVVDQRCAWIERNLRDPVFRLPLKSIHTTEGLIGKITYPNGSWILAIPQGEDAVRGYTPSIHIMDEADFQPEARKALTAALATREKRAQLVLTSTSNGPVGVVAGLCREVGFVRFG